MGSKQELACVYSALILVDDDVAITVSNFFPSQFDCVLKVNVSSWEFHWIIIANN